MSLSADAFIQLHRQLTPEFAGTLAGLALTSAAFFLSGSVRATDDPAALDALVKMRAAGRNALRAGWFFAVLLFCKTVGSGVVLAVLQFVQEEEQLKSSLGLDVPDVGMGIEAALFIAGMSLFLRAFAVAMDLSGGTLIPTRVWDLYRKLRAA